MRCLVLIVVLSLGMASLAVPSVSANEAAPLIERHIEWLGGKKVLEGLESLSFEGTITASGLSGPLSVVQTNDGRMRLEYDLKVVRGTEGLTPDDAWEINPSGQLEDMGVIKRDQYRRNLLEVFGKVLLGESPAQVSRLDPEERDGRQWEVVRFAFPNGDMNDLFLDPDDGSTVWSRQFQDGETIWLLQKDWRVINGFRVAFVQESQFEVALQNQTVTWSTVQINAGVDDAVFNRPGTQNKLARITGDSGSTPWIPLTLHRGSYLFFRGEANGEPIDIVLDSGAGITVLDAPVAKRLGLEGQGAIPAQGTGGTVSASIVNGVNITVGELELTNLSAAVIDLEDVNARLGRDLSIILGKEVFNNLIVDIDYPNSRIAFRDPEKYTYQGSGTPVTLIPHENGHRLVELAIGDLPPARFTLDTGNGGALIVFEHYSKTHGILESCDQLTEVSGGGVGGQTVSKAGSLDLVTLGGFKLRGVPTAFSINAKGAFETTQEAGNLGAGILRRFRVVFDYPNNVMYLEAGPEWEKAPYVKNRAGIQAIPENDGLTVFFVAPGSPAAKHGWKEGERIVAIDGKPVAKDYWSEQYLWVSGEPGVRLTLTLDTGEERNLVLKEYY